MRQLVIVYLPTIQVADELALAAVSHFYQQIKQALKAKVRPWWSVHKKPLQIFLQGLTSGAKIPDNIYRLSPSFREATELTWLTRGDIGSALALYAVSLGGRLCITENAKVVQAYNKKVCKIKDINELNELKNWRAKAMAEVINRTLREDCIGLLIAYDIRPEKYLDSDISCEYVTL